MKKNYFFTLLLSLLISGFTFGQTVVITSIIDGKAPSDGCSGTSGSSSPKAIELYVNGSVDFTGYKYEVEANGPSSTSEEFWSSTDISSLGVKQNEFIYIVAAGETTLFDLYSGVSQANTFSGGSSFNGNDAIRITDGTNVLDQYGDPSDVSGSSDHDNPWEYEDSYASRKSGSTSNAGTFNAAEWNIPGRNFLDDKTSCAAMANEVKFGSFKLIASTNPSLTIASPSDGAILSATTAVSLLIGVSNFNVAAGGTGDGYIKWKIDGVAQADKFNVDDEVITVVAGNSYTISMELVDNTGNSLVPEVSKTTIFSVKYPCDLFLGDITSVCNTITSGEDTYTTTIAYKGGNTGTTYTIDTKGVGIVEGDNPNTIAEGNITISGIPEGTNFTLQVTGGNRSSCDLSRNINSPVCLPLPIHETFSYTASQNLISNLLWSDASTSEPTNDIQVVLNNDGGGNPILGNYYSSNQLPDPTGNFVRLDGRGSDPFIGFEGKTSGTVYASFLFHVTNMDDFKANPNGGYFAILAESGGSFKSRLWIKDPTADGLKEGLTFQLGISTSGTASNVAYVRGFTANLAEPVFVVMAFDLSTQVTSLWINPDATSLGSTTIPSKNASLTAVGNEEASSIGRFVLRQDSDSETPTIDFDELRIGTSWKDVTSNPTADVKNVSINGFATYPNPITDKRFTITSNSSDQKNITIFNVLGKKVFTTNFSAKNKEINVSNINSGIYILKVIENGKTATKKLVIR
jgi:hypothetical protein